MPTPTSMPPDYDPTPTHEILTSGQRSTIFWALALVIGVVVVGLLGSALLPFIIGLAVAYMLNPLADRLHSWGVGRSFAAFLLVAFFSVLAVLALVLVIPWLMGELKELAANLPRYLEQGRKLIDDASNRWLGHVTPDVRARIDQGLKDLSQQWTTAAGTLVLSIVTGGKAVASLLSVLLITPVVAFYLLADWPRMVANLDRWLPRDHAQTIRRLAGEINAVLAGFARGQGTVCLVLAIFYALGLVWAGCRWGGLIGLLTGLLSFVPFVAFASGLAVASAVAVIESWPNWVPLAKVLGVFAAGQVLESAILSPRIVAGHIKLHPVFVILALFVFGYLFGFVGLLVAVPTAAAIGVLARFALEEYLRSPLYKGRQG